MRDIWVKRALSLILGGLGGVFSPRESFPWIIGLLVLLIIRIIFWQARDFFGYIRRPELILLAAGLVTGFILGVGAGSGLPEPFSQERVDVAGVLLDWNKAAEKASGVIRIEGNPVQDSLGEENSGLPIPGEKFRLTVYPDREGEIPQDWAHVQPGDRLAFTARLERAKPAGTEGEFDLRLYNAIHGLGGSLMARSGVTVLETGSPPLTWSLRQHVRKMLEFWSPDETGVLEGILFGDSSRIPPAIQEQYRVTGVLHVFAASGSNVALVLAFIWGLSWFVPYRLRIGLSILGLVFYAALCGGNAPIVRAAVLGVAALLGRLREGRISGLRWLMLAAVILFGLNPLILKDIGFQLSFAAAWGIIVLSPRMAEQPWLRKVPMFIRTLVVSTVAAQVATAPLLMMAFHRLSIVGLVANLLVLFIIGSVLELGLIGVFLSFSVWLSAPFFQAGLWLLRWTNLVLGILSNQPWADVWVLQPGAAFPMLWYGWIGVWLFGPARAGFIIKVQLRRVARLSTRIAKLGINPSEVENNYILRDLRKGGILRQVWAGRPKRWLGIAFLALFLWSPWSGSRDLELTVLDVGQGDAILIRTPNRHAVLIDSGPRSERFDAGEKVVLPYLLRNRVGHLDAFLITHEHQDHIGGAKALLANLRVDWVGVPATAELNNGDWQEGLPQNLMQEGKLKALRAGERLELDAGAFLEVLAPSQLLSGTHSDPNNNSLVLKLNYEGRTVLLTGDMEQEEMAVIQNTGMDFDAEFFKEPHHGSRFSLDEAWLDQVHPRAVFISVGRNTFGHPAPAVLNYWAERQVPVYRTDQEGTIRLLLSRKNTEIQLGRNP